jgi:uncharacterized DUF497 family protein
MPQRVAMPPDFPDRDFAEYEGYLEDADAGAPQPRFQFVWLPQVVEKLAQQHAVTPAEVEAVFENKPLITFHGKGYTVGENLYLALGQSHAGRYLEVYFIKKVDGALLILSAYDMRPSHRRRYERA